MAGSPWNEGGWERKPRTHCGYSGQCWGAGVGSNEIWAKIKEEIPSQITKSRSVGMCPLSGWISPRPALHPQSLRVTNSCRDVPLPGWRSSRDLSSHRGPSGTGTEPQEQARPQLLPRAWSPLSSPRRTTQARTSWGRLAGCHGARGVAATLPCTCGVWLAFSRGSGRIQDSRGPCSSPVDEAMPGARPLHSHQAPPPRAGAWDVSNSRKGVWGHRPEPAGTAWAVLVGRRGIG